MAKKNFFDRLTGSSPEIEEENPIEEEPEIKEQDFLEEEKNEISEEKKREKEEVVEDEPVSRRQPGEKEESDGGAEGQLTIDVYQTPVDVVIKSTIAGVSVEDLDIAITNDMVTIKGNRKNDEPVKQEDYYYQECYWGPFSRSIILPLDVKAEGAKASLKNGILTIRLPKVEKVKTKKIKVEVV